METNGTKPDRIEIRVIRWTRIIRGEQEFLSGYMEKVGRQRLEHA